MQSITTSTISHACTMQLRTGRQRCLVIRSDAATYRTTVRKPLGLVLAEDKATKRVFVEQIVAGGNADKAGRIKVGDVVRKCSATVLKAGKEGSYESEGYGQRPYDNWDVIMFDCDGQDFDTVMAAIGSNNERWGIFDVTLELQRAPVPQQEPAA